MNNYPKWICLKCGEKHGDGINRICTIHSANPDDPTDVCGWCGGKGALTEPRDYGHPKWEESNA